MVDANAPLEARWIVAELHATAATVNKELENYRYDNAANTIYQFFWGSFCDWYLEIVKLRLDFSETADKQATKAALTTLLSVFEASLRLLSPFMPFLTEEIWHAVYDGNPPAKSIALTTYPQAEGQYSELLKGELIYALISCSKHAVQEMSVLQKVVTALRALRKDAGVPEKEVVSARVYCTEKDGSLTAGYLTSASNLYLCNALARVKVELKLGASPHQGNIRSETGFDVEIIYEKQIDVAAETERLTRDIAKYEKGMAAAARQLGNEAFLAKAPAAVVEGLKKQAAETEQLLDKAKAALAALPKN
jgi:valyl-tRNA synthetase